MKTAIDRFAGTQRLFHVTHFANVPGILRYGLQTAFSRGRKKIWLCGQRKLAWALWQVPRAHGHHPSDYVILEVYIAPRLIRRNRKHIYTSVHEIANWQIRRFDAV